jgi:hypothetical protein
MSDTSGREVYVWGTDTSMTVEGVVRVVYCGAGYELTLRDSSVVKLPRPPFYKMEVVMTPDKKAAGKEELSDTAGTKHERRKDDDKERKVRK